MGMTRERQGPTWGGLLCAGILCLAVGIDPLAAQQLPQTEVRASLRAALAGVLEVPVERVELKSFTFREQSSTFAQRPTYTCACAVRTAAGRVLGEVGAEVDARDWSVYYVQWGTQQSDEMRRMATDFVARHFPGWSDEMVLLSEEWGESRSVNYSWHEKRGQVWTGTYAYAHFYRNRPGRPYFYGGYTATPRTLEDVTVSRDEAIQAALSFAHEQDAEDPRAAETELYLDSHLYPYPQWRVTIEFGTHEQWGDELPRSTIIVHGQSGELMEPSEDGGDEG